MTLKTQRGFTLIEIMVVVAILAIVAAIAIPSYRDYVIRANIMPAVSGLSSRQTLMEQCYQDNHTYDPTAGCPGCVENDTTSDTRFDFKCKPGEDGKTFTLTAKGKGQMSAFEYTVNQAGDKATTVTSGPSGWSGNTGCWVTSKGGAC